MTKHKNNGGFSLIEILVVIVLLSIIAVMSMDAFNMILKQSSLTMQTVTTDMEQTVGLDILRYDIEQAGFGLPWSFQGPIHYTEATTLPASTYNDSPSSPPRAILSGNNAGYNNSDYLVIKSTIVAGSDTSSKWTYVLKDADTAPKPKSWTTASKNLNANDRVIVIKPRHEATGSNELVMDSGSFFTSYSINYFSTYFSPATLKERFIIYGVDPDTDLKMPFNRADYYIKVPSAGIPSKCASNTGILYKATVNQKDGALTEMPILDCVADMQIIFRLDTGYTNNITPLTAGQIRERLKEVRVYLLTHEGSIDKKYTHGSSNVTVGEFGLGNTFNLVTGNSDWSRYRWKVIALSLKPKNIF